MISYAMRARPGRSEAPGYLRTMADGFDVRDEQRSASDKELEQVLRPRRFEEFAGQKAVTDNLKVFVQAAKGRSEALDHVLLHGPPGLGKTTLANIIAQEMGVGIRITSGPVLDKPAATDSVNAWVCQGVSCLPPLADLGRLEYLLDQTYK